MGDKLNAREKKFKFRFRSIATALMLFLAGMLFLRICNNFFSVSARSHSSEAKQNLGAIYTAYQSYFSDNHTYPSSPFISVKFGNTVHAFNCLEIADWEPKGTTGYAYKCMDSIAFKSGLNPKSDCSKVPIATHADATSFTVAACASIDGDKYFDEWTMDDAKHLRQVSNGFKHNIKHIIGDILFYLK